MSEEESIAPEGYEQKSSSDKPNQQSNEQEGEPKEPLPQPERQPLPIAIGTQPENMETHTHITCTKRQGKNCGIIYLNF